MANKVVYCRQFDLYCDPAFRTAIYPSALQSTDLRCDPSTYPCMLCFVLSLRWFGPSRLRLCVEARLTCRTFICRCRRGVTEVYGDLNDIDSIDWAKISNVDVCLHSLSLLVSLVKARVVLTCTNGVSPCHFVIVASNRPCMNHIVDTCPLTKLEGGLNLLHKADDNAVIWLEFTVTAALVK